MNDSCPLGRQGNPDASVDPDRNELTEGVSRMPVSIWDADARKDVLDRVADEVPVALVFNGISHAVMMATPDHLDDFALGFGLTEGLLETPAELYGVDVNPVANGVEIHLEVASACAWRLRERRRNLAGRTGCGLCGTDSLDQVRQQVPEVFPVQLDIQAIFRAESGLKAKQVIRNMTGATHAAAWCDRSGEVLLLREDVGRHNALDKLIGAMIRAGIDPAQGFIAITSRASFEMVQKTAMARAGALIAVSAPTGLAIDTARQHGIALAGLVRDGRRLVAYTWPERLGLSEQG